MKKLAGEDFIIRSSITCKLHQILLGWSNQGLWDRRSCSTHGRVEKYV